MGAPMEGPALRFSHIDAENKKFKGFVDVPFQAWSTKATIDELESEISGQLGLRVAYIAYRGVRVRRDRQISNFIPDLQQGACSRFSVHTTTGKNVFFVKSLEGNSVMVDLPLATSTVRELKAEVNYLEKIPIEYQRFQYEGKHFSDAPSVTKSLRDYGVERDSTVHLLTRLRGGAIGIEFPDLQNQNALRTLPWAKTAPVWRQATRGLNLEGRCGNRACAAYGRRVICKMGYTAINLVTEVAPCPVCKQPVQVKTCSFTSCSWMFEGRKTNPPKRIGLNRITGFITNCFAGKSEESEKPASRDIVSPWYKSSNKYEYFRQTNNMVQWENLIVVAKKPPTLACNSQLAVVPMDEKCSICFQNFDNKLKTHTTSCHHTFHTDCVESWLASSGTACPICREDLVVEK